MAPSRSSSPVSRAPSSAPYPEADDAAARPARTRKAPTRTTSEQCASTSKPWSDEDNKTLWDGRNRDKSNRVPYDTLSKDLGRTNQALRLQMMHLNREHKSRQDAPPPAVQQPSSAPPPPSTAAGAAASVQLSPLSQVVGPICEMDSKRKRWWAEYWELNARNLPARAFITGKDLADWDRPLLEACIKAAYTPQ